MKITDLIKQLDYITDEMEAASKDPETFRKYCEKKELEWQAKELGLPKTASPEQIEKALHEKHVRYLEELERKPLKLTEEPIVDHTITIDMNKEANFFERVFLKRLEYNIEEFLQVVKAKETPLVCYVAEKLNTNDDEYFEAPIVGIVVTRDLALGHYVSKAKQATSLREFDALVEHVVEDLCFEVHKKAHEFMLRTLNDYRPYMTHYDNVDFTEQNVTNTVIGLVDKHLTENEYTKVDYTVFCNQNHPLYKTFDIIERAKNAKTLTTTDINGNVNKINIVCVLKDFWMTIK